MINKFDHISKIRMQKTYSGKIKLPQFMSDFQGDQMKMVIYQEDVKGA